MSLYRVKKIVARTVGSLVDLDGRVHSKKDLRVIFAYHRVLSRDYVQGKRIQSAMWVSEETFAAQLDWMMRVGRVVSLKDIINFEKKSDTPLFCVTFDDGWRDNYTVAFRMLQQRNIPATIFLATEAIQSGRAFWVEELIWDLEAAINIDGIDALSKKIEEALGVKRNSAQDFWLWVDEIIEGLKLLVASERLAQLELVRSLLPQSGGMSAERAMMTWDEIREMQNAGIDFQSHTHSHRILKYIEDDQIALELQKSKEILESELLREIDVFCYPNARYPDRHNDALYERCGYRYGVKIDNQFLKDGFNQYLIPRLLMNEDNSSLMPYLKFRLLGVPKY